MVVASTRSILDPLYGEVRFDNALASLLQTPTLQRLRHVRLSNIDSIDLPSIANISRFEHVVGVAHLSGLIGFSGRMDPFDYLALRAAALLHDWAITSFGHLVEEGLQYVGTRFDHEDKLRRVLLPDGDGEIGGADLQILMGFSTGLGPWAQKFGKEHANLLIERIMELIAGRSRYGAAIAGSIDLDNIDNVFRMAFHMGIAEDISVPRRLAEAMVGVDDIDGSLVLRHSSVPLLQEWRRTRKNVYTRLMLSAGDFAGKLMLLYATVRAYEVGEIKPDAWSLVDHEFLYRLTASEDEGVRETARRWIRGDLWDCAPLQWLAGSRPDYPELLSFGADLKDTLGRPCFAYGIKDKRDRRLTVKLDDGRSSTFGVTPDRWLLGVGSAKRQTFSSAEIKMIVSMAEKRFRTSSLGAATIERSELQESLF